MHRHTARLFSLAFIVAVALTGCGSETAPPAADSPAPPAADSPAPAAPAPTTDAAPQVAEPPATPADGRAPLAIAEAFMAAGNSGDKDAFLGLMTEKAATAMAEDETGTFNLEPGQFTSYEIGEASIDGTQAKVAVSAVQAESDEPLTMNLTMRQEPEGWRVYGIQMELVEGMSMDLNFESLAESMAGLMEGMVDTLGQGLQDAFDGAFGPATPEQLAQAKAKYESIAPLDAAAFEAGWTNGTDYSGKTAGEAIAGLASAMGLRLNTQDADDGFDTKLSEPLTGMSFAEAMEKACAAAGVYPEYVETYMASGMWRDMAQGMAAALEEVIPGAAEADSAAEEVTPGPVVALHPGSRPYPVVFTGPFLVEISDIEEDAPYGTGQLSMSVYAFNLSAAVTTAMADAMETVSFSAVNDRDGNPLVDLDMQFMGGGELDGAMYVDFYMLEMRNLLQAVQAIAEVSGLIRVGLPTAVEEVVFDSFVEGEGKSAGDLRVTLTNQQSLSDTDYTTEFEVRGPNDLTQDMSIAFLPFDAEGNQLEVMYSSSYPWGDGQVQASLNTPAAVASVRLKLVGGLEQKEYPFAFNDVPLARFNEQPEMLEPLTFDGDAPVEITFKEFGDLSDPNFAEIVLTLNNTSNKAITGVFMTLHYLAEDGTELGDFPNSLNAFGQDALAEAGATTDHETTAFSMPAETKTIRAEINSVSFIDGNEWLPEAP